MSPGEWLKVLNDDEALVVVLRGHLWLESLLNLLLTEALPEPNALELERMSFEPRLQMAVAMGLLDQSHVGGFLKANWLRNRFAHDPEFELSDGTATDFRNAVSRHVIPVGHPWGETGDDALGTVRRNFGILMAHLETLVTRVRDQKTRERVLHEMVEETLSSEPTPAGPSAREDRIEERVRAERQARREKGEL